MAGNSKRTIVQLESTSGSGYRYTVTKSKRNHPGRLEYVKYDPVIRKRVIFKETKYKMCVYSPDSDMILLLMLIGQTKRIKVFLKFG